MSEKSVVRKKVDGGAQAEYREPGSKLFFSAIRGAGAKRQNDGGVLMYVDTSIPRTVRK